MLNIRSASTDDSTDILEWRNDSLSRQFSINSKLINRIDHIEWLKKNLNNPNNYLFICSVNRQKVGFVRYEKKRNDRFYVSINMNPKFRNKGLAVRILINSQNRKKIKETNRLLYARIKINNLRSIRAFKKAGYEQIRKLNGYYLFCNHKNHDTLNNMSKTSKKNKYENIIDQIELIRSKNNGNWMDILRIAYKYSPKETAKVMSQIYKQDQKISSLAKKLEK